MELLLEKLYNSLFNVFEENLDSKDKKYNENEELDILRTLLTLSKHQKDKIRLLEMSAIEKAVLIYEFTKDVFEECVKQKVIRQGLTINDSRYYIGTYGLYYFYQYKKASLDNIFITYDESNFSTEKIVLKSPEKIWCIFLILFGADKFESRLDTSKWSHRELEKYLTFLTIIEEKLLNKGITLGKKVTWGTGKDSSFRGFITNNNLLPKTGIYFDRPTYNYYLDLTQKKNAKYLLDLILDSYTGVERIMVNELFRMVLRELSNLMVIELSIVPGDLNHFVKDELYG
jgi:hypothetical protein